MKVKKLIKKLQKLDQNATVLVLDANAWFGPVHALHTDCTIFVDVDGEYVTDVDESMLIFSTDPTITNPVNKLNGTEKQIPAVMLTF